MSLNNKRTLSMIVYYTLAILAILASAFFVYCLTVKEVVLWARIIYFIWVGLVIGAIIYDIVCTTTGEGKQMSGFVIYVLSLLAVIMTCILYFVNSSATGLAVSFFNLFISVSIISLITTGFMIATWCVGEKLVENATAREEMIRKN